MKKHINLSNWTLSITDWTNLNYVLGGLDEAYADAANVKGNYIKRSENLCIFSDVAETTAIGVTWKVENGVITANGTVTNGGQYLTFVSGLNIQLKANKTYAFNNFGSTSLILYSSSGNVIDVASTTVITPTQDTTIIGIRKWVTTGLVFDNVVWKPMLVKGPTIPSENQPGSTSGLYIEDNVNDVLIPINESELLRNISIVVNTDKDMR